jgi:hypothetical protein
MPRPKPARHTWIRTNRLGCFVIAGVIAAFLIAAVYIGVSSPARSDLNSVIHTVP